MKVVTQKIARRISWVSMTTEKSNLEIQPHLCDGRSFRFPRHRHFSINFIVRIVEDSSLTNEVLKNCIDMENIIIVDLQGYTLHSGK